MRNLTAIALSFPLATQVIALSSTDTLTSLEDSLHCTYAIVGAGAGGLRLAARLAPHLEATDSTLCIFERESRIGGRIYDYRLGYGDEFTDENGKKRGEGIEIVGLGGWRYDETHQRVR
jgi:monoamine oxidase